MTSDMCNFTRDKSNLDTRESHRLIPRGACDKGHDRSIYLSAQWVSQAVRGERREGGGWAAKTDRAASLNRNGRDQRERVRGD